MMNLKNNSQHAFEQSRLSNSLPEAAYQAIHDAIICGRIEPGEPLHQAELAQELGVSARTVREALSRLVAEGLAEYEPHHSVRVADLTMGDQEELYLMRVAIEGMAFEAAAEYITPQDLARLKEIMPMATQSSDPQSAETTRHYNQEFHWIIIRASGKRQFMRVLDQIWKSMFTYFVLNEVSETDLKDARQRDKDAHAAIIKALEERDGKRARALVEEHILVTSRYQSLQMKE